MINVDRIEIIKEKIKKAVAQIEKEEKVTVEFGSSRYNDAYFTTTMKVKTTEKNVVVNSAYEVICKGLGFTQNIIGMKFIGKNGIYEIIDIATRNRKYPVIAKSEDDKQFKYSVAHIKLLIGGDKIINRNANLDKLISE